MVTKKIAISLVLLFLLINIGNTAAPLSNEGKKFQRLKVKGDKYFEGFSYRKAIVQYEKALEIASEKYIKLQLANCYRLLNDPANAVKWYDLTLEEGKISTVDMLHYGQVLSAVGRYEESLGIFEKYQRLENWADDKMDGFLSMDQFYGNQEAFVIKESSFNSSEKDFSPTIRGEEVVFVTNRESSGFLKPTYNWDGSSFLDLFVVREGEAPQKIHRGINTRFHEGPATFFDDNRKMVFTRNDYAKKKAGKSDEGVNKLTLFYSERKHSQRWRKPLELPFSNDNYSMGHPTMTSDGRTMYFASDMPGGVGGVDIWKVDFDPETKVWGNPENMGPIINTSEDEMFPFIHRDSTLYFSSSGHKGLGALDIFRSELFDLYGFDPRNLGFPLNTNTDDFGITLDEKNKGYYSSNRPDGTGDDDIYEVTIFDYIVSVTLVDFNTFEPIIGDMVSYEEILESSYDTAASVADSTRIVFKALRGTGFKVGGISPGYYADTLEIKTGNKSRDILRLDFKLPLLPIERGDAEIIAITNNGAITQLAYLKDSVLLDYEMLDVNSLEAHIRELNLELSGVTQIRNIYYDYYDSAIRKDASLELDKLVDYLLKSPDILVEFSSHTDTRGSIDLNKKLAERRGVAAKQYLVKKGVTEDRIFLKSYGETSTFIDCDPDCDERQHQKNRRTEIRLLYPEK